MVQTVHSSHGRLRVHLPAWSGTGADALADQLRRLHGVRDAQASRLTGNVLILFDPRQTRSEILLGELEALPTDVLAAPASAPTPRAALPARVVHPSAPPRVRPALPELTPVPVRTYQYVTGIRRVIYRFLGWSSVGMAIVGAILPGIPTAPFVILAGYFFIRSSQSAHEWLLRHRWFGPLLRDWEAYHAIRRSLRNAAVALIVFAAVLVSLLGLPVAVLATIYGTQLIGLVIVLRLRVIDRRSPALLPAPQ